MGLGLTIQRVSQYPVRASIKTLALRDVMDTMLIKEPVHTYRLGDFNDVSEILWIAQSTETAPDNAALCTDQLHCVG